MMLLSVWRL